MRELEQGDIERGAAGVPQDLTQPNVSMWRFGGWLSRLIRRGCSNGMWTISRDGKLGCEPLICDACQPE